MGREFQLMKLEQTSIAGVGSRRARLTKTSVGRFPRLFCSREQADIIGSRSIVQINHSITRRVGALRGLHYQTLHMRK